MKTFSVRMRQLRMNTITTLRKNNTLNKQIIFTMPIEVDLIIPGNNITNNGNVLNIKNTFLRSIILQMCLAVVTIILEIMYILNMIIESSITQLT